MYNVVFLCTCEFRIEFDYLRFLHIQSKFDDYYELRIGQDSCNHWMDCDDNDDRKNKHGEPFTYFQINRPLPEGSKPSLSNGFQSFNDVRGESGTRVTILLSDDAIKGNGSHENISLCVSIMIPNIFTVLAAGFLNEKEVLVPILEKVLEKSPYLAAFYRCCCQDEIDSILFASEKEEREIKIELDHTDASSFDVSDVSLHTGTSFIFFFKKFILCCAFLTKSISRHEC